MTGGGEAGVYRVDQADGVLTLSFTRPEAGNALPSAAAPELRDLFAGINADPDARVLLVRGEGRNFSAGADVRGFGRSLEQSREERQADFAHRLAIVSEMVEAYLTLEVPIVVACQGGVAGVAMLFPLGADVVLADETARFMFAQQRVGLTPDGGVTYLLPRIVGVRRAKELVLSAATVDADEAYRLGIVSRIVPGDSLQEEAAKQARRFARSSQGTARTAKRLIAASLDSSLSEQLAAERAGIVGCVGDADFEEGVRALLEKRPASFPSTAGRGRG